MRRLIMWDVDGTLLNHGGVSREAFAAAFEEVVERPFLTYDYQFSGRLDPQVAREALAAAGIVPQEVEGLVRRILRRHAVQLASREAELRSRGRALPGVRAVLERLYDEGVYQTVVTGNIAVNAVLKLQAFQLVKFLDMEVGAFGSDASTRAELVELVLDRMEHKRNQWFDDDEIWVVGDTPHDLEAAQDNDVRCLLVATGRYPYEDLEALKPDALLRDLSDVTAVVELLMG